MGVHSPRAGGPCRGFVVQLVAPATPEREAREPTAEQQQAGWFGNGGGVHPEHVCPRYGPGLDEVEGVVPGAEHEGAAAEGGIGDRGGDVPSARQNRERAPR